MNLIYALVTSAAAFQMNVDDSTMWSSFKAKYGKSYSATEETERFGIFQTNLRRAEISNKMNPNAQFGVTEFMDMSSDEFKCYTHGMTKLDFSAERVPLFTEEQVRSIANDTIDWRTKGAVTAVKNQARCGSCWSFSTTGHLEGQWFLANQKLTPLSEEQILDCDTKGQDHGCNGGLMLNAFKYILGAGGLEGESDYPYTAGNGQTGQCRYEPAKRQAFVSDAGKLLASDENQMQTWLAANGPIAIAVDAVSPGASWQTYQGGILSGCTGRQLDHGVLAVGVGTDASKGKYWIIKNSWGASWGEQGYIRVEFGSNQCDLNAYPSVVTSGKGPMPPAPPTPPVPPGPPPPPPSPSPGPADSFTQLQCGTDSSCQQCNKIAFPQNQCLPAMGGGSVMAGCKGTSMVEEKIWATDPSCSGTPDKTRQVDTNKCVQDSTGNSYFEDICPSPFDRLTAPNNKPEDELNA